jgi:hypothetical protein
MQEITKYILILVVILCLLDKEWAEAMAFSMFWMSFFKD